MSAEKPIDGTAQTKDIPRRRTGLYLGVTVAGIVLSMGVFLVILAAKNMRGGREISFCKSNLRFLSIGLRQYAEDNAGNYPPDLGRLFPKYLADDVPFRCPAYARQGSCLREGIVKDAVASYVYLPGRTADMPGTLVVAYDRLGNHEGKGLVAVDLDCATYWVAAKDLPRFQRRLALEQEAVDKWRRSGKPADALFEFMGPEWGKLAGMDGAPAQPTMPGPEAEKKDQNETEAPK